MPALATSVRLHPDEYDALALQVAAGVREGLTGEPEARQSIAALVFRSGVVHDVVKGVVHGRDTSLIVHEVESWVNDRLYDHLIDGGPEVFDLDRLVDDQVSVIGWARIRARFIAVSRVRDLRDRAARNTSLSTPVGNRGSWAPLTLGEVLVDDSDHAGSPHHALLAPAHECEASRLAEAVEDARYPSRDPELRRAQSQTLRALIGAPAPLAPRSRLEKYELRQILARDPGAAMRALTGRHDPATAGVDPRVAAMWDDYGPEEVALVMEAVAATTDPEATVALLAYEALHTPNRPIAKTVAALARTVAAMSRMTGWKASATRLVAGYLAVTRTAVSCGDNRTSEERRAALTIERDELARQWPTVLAEHLAAFPASPLGADEDQVAATLDLLLNDLDGVA